MLKVILSYSGRKGNIVVIEETKIKTSYNYNKCRDICVYHFLVVFFKSYKP